MSQDVDDVLRERKWMSSGPRQRVESTNTALDTSSVQHTGARREATHVSSPNVQTRSNDPDPSFTYGEVYTASPESSPQLKHAEMPYQDAVRAASITESETRTSSIPLASSLADGIPNSRAHSQTSRPKPKPSRLNTNLAPLTGTSPPRAISPSLKHWQQVRSHVIAPTPSEEKPTNRPLKKLGLVTKAAGKFGFRQAAENVMGYDQRRSTMDGGGLGDLTLAEKEDIARERRKFARDIKACLDACSLEESRRRLTIAVRKETKPTSVHGFQHTAQRLTFDSEFSPFAPLLTEIHRHLPAARAKKPWSRTCPHHAAILAELGVAFLPDSIATAGERQQALEVFGTVIRNWAADDADEQLERWLWLCRAMKIDDPQLRRRGINLLVSSLHQDPALPLSMEVPHSDAALQALVIGLLGLRHAVSGSEYMRVVDELLAEISEGSIIIVDRLSSTGLMDLEIPAGCEKEILWMAVVKSLPTQPRILYELGRYRPLPLALAAAPAIAKLRSTSTAVLISSLTLLLQQNTPPEEVWNEAQSLLPDLERMGEGCLPQFAELLVRFELLVKAVELGTDEDPFTANARPDASTVPAARNTLYHLSCYKAWKDAILDATRRIIDADSLSTAANLIRRCLITQLAHIGRLVVPPFLTRLSTFPMDEINRPILDFLAISHPQLFYKPLFSLSASTTPQNLAVHLRVVLTVSRTLGVTRYWIEADPQMILIVLMGDSSPKAAKGKGREGKIPIIPVKIGRYAVLNEIIKSLADVESGKIFRRYAEIIESKLSFLLEAEEMGARLPDGYRALLCRLFYVMREKTKSTKRSAWQKLAVEWYIASHEQDESDNNVDAVEAASTAISQAIGGSDGAAIKDPHSEYHTLRSVSASLLVLIHVCLDEQDLAALSPFLWDRLQERNAVKATAFLFLKCCEILPEQVRQLVMYDIYSLHPQTRSTALGKIALLYGWRYQILSQTILTDKRGPIFHFPARTLDFVATEIGSAIWTAPQDVQDAALKKFGNTLPLELRQRLMELGWSEDDSISTKTDWEKIPITNLPTLHHQHDTSTNEAGSPMKALARSTSTGSDGSIQTKRRKAVFAPILLEVLYDQANHPDSLVSREVIKMFQRDDPAMFLRPFTDGLKDDFTASLAKLNAVAVCVTPGFAYAAFNAIVGYLKTVLRTDSGPPYYAAALATCTHLVGSVSSISLRDIRKNKAEHVLLPASIHEDEGGFKVHHPWREGQHGVQTAQLLILTEILRTNPRDVYLIKKMLSNLAIQGSISHIPFARAWLILIVQLFSTLNRNYNDRAELRHFLSNVAVILQMHGTRDILITSHALRIFILCSARFRRLFASMGFGTVMPSVYTTYQHGNTAIRDCVEYAARSFYRIHQDVFVYTTCLTIADGEYDPAAVYSLLSCLSKGNSRTSGVASGLRGLNDEEEMETLVQMIISGPEIAISEIGTDAAERQASKYASITLDDNIFPKENIIKLFITVIAANPATNRARNFLRLFTALVPHMSESPELLRDGVEALGAVIARGKAGDASAMLAFHAGGDEGEVDWWSAKREYVHLVEAFTRSGGRLSATGMWRTMEMIQDLLRRQPESIDQAAVSIIGHLAKTHLSGPKPHQFLKDIAPIFRTFLSVVDFSGLLNQITPLIEKMDYTVDADTSKVVIEGYIEPAIRVMATAAEDGLAFSVPFRESVVALLSVAIYLKGDVWSCVEMHTPTAGLLAALIMPFSLRLAAVDGSGREEVYHAIWVRLLHYILPPHRSRTTDVRSGRSQSMEERAAGEILVIQLIKVIVVRAPDSISRVKGLWTYISQYLLRYLDSQNSEVFNSAATPRLVDWIKWSIFELVSLHPTPLQTLLRYPLQASLPSVREHQLQSRPSTPGNRTSPTSHSPQLMSVRDRLSSTRSPSLATHSRQPARTPEFVGHSRLSSVSPSPIIGHQPRIPSQHLTPFLSGHSRIPSSASARPTFADLSARRVSRPVFEDGGGQVIKPNMGLNIRFPSSATVRQVDRKDKGGGGAIVHLLGASSHVLSAPGVHRLVGDKHGVGEDVWTLRLKNEILKRDVERAIRACMLIAGYGGMVEEEEGEAVRVWSAHDALDVINEQTRVLVEAEFRAVVLPGRNGTAGDKGAYDFTTSHDDMEKEGINDDHKDEEYIDDDDHGNDHYEDVPLLAVSSP